MAKVMEVKKIGLIFQESHVERKKSMGPWYKEGLLKRDFTNTDNLSRRLSGEMSSDHRQTHTVAMPVYLHMLIHTYTHIHIYIPLNET